MGLNDSNAANKQSVNDCGEKKVIFIGLFSQCVVQMNTVLYPHGRTTAHTHRPGTVSFNVVNTEAELEVLTLAGFSWLMMVVFPLLSSPKHKTLTSFFLRPSHPDSLSSSPIRLNQCHTINNVYQMNPHMSDLCETTARDLYFLMKHW